MWLVKNESTGLFKSWINPYGFDTVPATTVLNLLLLTCLSILNWTFTVRVDRIHTV